MSTLALLPFLLVGAARDADASRLAVVGPMPAFTLTRQDGKTLKSSALRGKVVVVSFIFTTCTGTCPATTLRMGLLARKLDKQGLFKGDRVRLISITLDPARDTLAVLSRYAALHDADPAHWIFLTGPVERVKKVNAAWDMKTTPTPAGLDHPSRVYLIDARGRIREIYSLEFFRPAWVIEDVQELLKEADKEG